MSDYYALDKNRLDEEWAAQDGKYRTAALLLADAQRDFEIAETQVDLISAKISLDVRESPEDYHVDKITEDAIKAVIKCHADYIQAVHDKIQAGHLVAVLLAEVKTLDHRKKALEKLVDLRLASYFAEPRLSSNASQKADQTYVNNAFKKKQSDPESD